MSEFTVDPDSPARLRQQAQQQLVAGIAPVRRDWSISVEALALLHRLASTPGSAGDALKLLHELQVHQVELDLLQTQLEANEHELTGELTLYRALFEFSPAAHVVLDARGRIEQCNRVAAELLGVHGDDAQGRRFDEFLSADSRLPLAALLRDARSGAMNPCRAVRPAGDPGDTQRWQVAARALPASDAIVLVVADTAGSADG